MLLMTPRSSWRAAALLLLTSGATAQVRLDLRTMHIDGLEGVPSPSASFRPMQVNAFAVGDVDGDGDLDLLGAGNSGPSRVWLNDGDGAFVRYASIGHGGTRCALFDVDGDGDLDAFVAGGRTAYEGPSACGLHLNDGTGSFSYSATIPNGPSNSSVVTRGLAIGDIDNDGDGDIVLFLGAGYPNSTMRVWRNTGAAVFVDDTAVVQPIVANSEPGTLADVDSDGDLDIVFGYGPTCGVRLNDGTGHFGNGPTIAFTMPAVDRAVADVDGDGSIDQLGVQSDSFGSGVADVPWLRRNIGNDQYQDVSSVWFEPHALVDRTIGYSFHCCAVFDADGDGDPDLVTGGCEGRAGTSTTVGVPPRVFLNIGGQRFVDASRPAFPMKQEVPGAIEAGDVDGDGDVDLVISQSWDNELELWRQSESGVFSEPTVIPVGGLTGTEYYALKLVDVDADGDRDLFAAAGGVMFVVGGFGQHRLLLNDGAGNFNDVTSARVPTTAFGMGTACDVGDVDGDGDQDIVVGSQGYPNPGAPLLLLLNNGSGSFTHATAQMPTTAFQCGSVALRDFDGDGDLDLAVGNSRFFGSQPSALFFSNAGAGNFVDETAARLTVAPGSFGLSVVDLDQDGDLDIAQSEVNHVNNGSGYFTASSAGPSPWILVADLDEDGVPDPVYDGTGSFGNWNNPCHVTPVDLDADGDRDLVVAPIPQLGNPGWTLFRVDLVYNLARDLRVVTQPRVGQPYRMRLRATNGTQPTVAVTLLATQMLSPRVPIGTWGDLALDPAALIPWEAVVIPDSDTAVESVLNVPNQPGFLGLPLTCQALTIPIGAEHRTHFTNAMTHTIER